MLNKICGRCEEHEKLKGRKLCLSCINFLNREKVKQNRAIKKLREERKKMKKKEKRENSISRLIKRADILFSQAVRLRDGACRLTGLKENLQCSHIWGRANKLIRWDLDNALTLTAGKHLYWWHSEPVEAVEWAKQLLGAEKWEELKRKKNQPFKLTAEFIKERIKFLEEYIKSLSTGSY